MAKDASGHRLGTKLRNTSLPLCIFFSIYTVCYIIIIILNPSMKINAFHLNTKYNIDSAILMKVLKSFRKLLQ